MTWHPRLVLKNKAACGNRKFLRGRAKLDTKINEGKNYATPYQSKTMWAQILCENNIPYILFLCIVHLIWRQGKIVQLRKQFTTDKLNVQLQNTYHNSYFICTSAKLYVGIVHSFSTSAKEKAKLQNTWHNCKTTCTTAKKTARWRFSFALSKFYMFCQGKCQLSVFFLRDKHTTFYGRLHVLYVSTIW